ncbi:KPN_02809 family neutral zinc metallopeptidase [Canibacter zhoujuaniae]|uniref:KPN_02809 family neutral zinc metallopeptidase n=1 Tax=Canibacter zhoujuaniae TaxID=2708343 RepID=UPI001FB8A077|nr:neutral zinc metallopeptidase [Canibacter zhoujuaniae]
MAFNDNSSFDSRSVRRRSGGGGFRPSGRGAAIGGGGGLLLLIIGFLSVQYLGVDVTQLLNGGASYGSNSYQPAYQDEDFSCTGAEANSNQDCRFEGAAYTLEQYWAKSAAQVGVESYHDPKTILYNGSTSSACGAASNAVGPFYCSADESIYIDGNFFEILKQRYGAQGGPLAEMYVLAHEWGHHIQHLQGVLRQVDHRDVGPDSGMVRLELQADCYAGAWMGEASQVEDASGNRVLYPPTEAELLQTVSAAQAVGDDNIQQQSGMSVEPETFSHGSSEQRVRWLMRGYENGATSCDTFAVAGNQL